MRFPSPFNLLAIVALAVAMCAGPVFACVCADGTATVQMFTRYCDGTDHDASGVGECEEGCETSQVAGDVPTPGQRTATVTPPPSSPAFPAWVTVDLASACILLGDGHACQPASPEEARPPLRGVILIV